MRSTPWQDRKHVHRVGLTTAARPQNPFATRFTRPGEIPYCFDPIEATSDADDNADVDASTPNRCDDRCVQARRLVRRLADYNCGLIVGPHGSGKSTLLHTLAPALREQYVSVYSVQLTACDRTGRQHRWRHTWRTDARVRRLIRAAKPGSLLVIDGAEQISRLQWQHVLGRARRVGFAILATSHRPLFGIDVLYRTSLDAKLVRLLTFQLLGNAPTEIAQTVIAQLERRDLNRVANLRELWFELYDLVQRRLLPANPHLASYQRNGCEIAGHHDSIPSTIGWSGQDGRGGGGPINRG